MTDTAAALFEQGVKFHGAGDLTRAAELYRRAIARDPAHTHALHLFGIVAYQVGDLEDAAALIGRATELDPAFADAFTNLGTVLQA
jgi:Flp pilus assembly protein TadD